MGVIFHRLERIWGKDAHLFDPSRWGVDRKEEIKPYQFLAFHGGFFLLFLFFLFISSVLGEQRCLGEVMAIQEAKVVLSALSRSFHFELATPDNEVISILTLVLSIDSLILVSGNCISWAHSLREQWSQIQSQ